MHRMPLLLAATLVVPACSPTHHTSPPPSTTSELYATVDTPVGSQSGAVSITYRIVDTESDLCTVAIECSTDAGVTWAAATAAPGGDGTSALASSPAPGTVHAFYWNSLMDAAGRSVAEPDVRVRITPADIAAGGAGATGDFTVDNSGNGAPSLGLAAPAGTESGLVSLAYALTDAESDLCAVTAEFSTNGGASWSPAFAGPGGDGTSNLPSSPGGGTAHVFVWNSFADGAALTGPDFFVMARITPTDGLAGSPGSQTFTVDNSSKSSGGMISSAFPVTQPAADFLDIVATDGRWLYLGGSMGGGAGSDTSWRVEKRDPVDGSLDTSFGTGGALVLNLGPGRDEVSALAIDGSALYIGGTVELSLGSDTYSLHLEKRSLTTGAPVASFGTGGALDLVSATDFSLMGMAIDASHLYVVATEGVGPPSDTGTHLEKRRLTDGGLVTSFGTAGVVTSNVDPGTDLTVGIATDGTFIYLTGVIHFDTDPELRVEKRSAVDGSLVTSVGVNRSVGGEEIVAAMTISTSSVFTLEMVETAPGSSTFEWRVTKWRMSDLGVVATATSAAVSGDFTLGSIVKLGPTIYVTCMDGAGGWGSDTHWRIEKRSAIDLTLDTSFDGDGVVISDPGTGEDVSRGLAIAGGVLYIVGFEEQLAGPQHWRVEARFE